MSIFALVLVSTANANNVNFAEQKLQIQSQQGLTHEFTVEIADTKEKQQLGLMGRKNMAEDRGMLFLFENPRKVNMWMKDTYIPLDMVFINTDNTISKIAENTTPMSLETISSDGDVAAIVEINGGICKKLGIKEHDLVSF